MDESKENDMVKVRSECIRRVKEFFDNAGIVIQEPIYRLVVNEIPKNSSVNSENCNKPIHVTIEEVADNSVQGVEAENTVENAINAELARADENPLSDHNEQR